VNEWKEIIIKNFVAIDSHCNKVLWMMPLNTASTTAQANLVILGYGNLRGATIYLININFCCSLSTS
jgi:hypothetical protein